MYTKQPKKMLIMNILDILRRHSDQNHTLSQKQIMELLKKEYDMDADRKTVKRNLMNLLDFGYELNYKECVRRNKDGEEEAIYTDWYLEREFADSELRLLIDSLLFSKHIPYNQCKALISKIEGLSSQHFRSKVRHVSNLPVEQPYNPEMFLSIEVLDEAIDKGLKVEFNYGDYGTDKKIHLRKNSDGSARSYLVNPYQMAATNGRYYLIANMDKHSNVAHYRIDRIRNIRLVEEAVKPQREVDELKYGLDLPKHMAEHVYMYSGESRRVTLRTAPDMAGELIDWFGNGVTFSNVNETSMLVHVTVNLQAMRFWALQYAPYVTVLEPKELVEIVKADLNKATENYKIMEDEFYGKTSS